MNIHPYLHSVNFFGGVCHSLRNVLLVDRGIDLRVTTAAVVDEDTHQRVKRLVVHQTLQSTQRLLDCLEYGDKQSYH